jgi:hypothetical protein
METSMSTCLRPELVGQHPAEPREVTRSEKPLRCLHLQPDPRQTRVKVAVPLLTKCSKPLSFHDDMHHSVGSLKKIDR